MLQHLLFFLVFCANSFLVSVSSRTSSSCRSYCGNVTVSYPFALRPGCGHAGFRDLLFCINDNLMLHIPSGSYRVLDIDYAYRALTLHDHSMSDCYSLCLDANANGGFVIEPWRAPYLEPDPDNIFMLLSCHAQSPLFQGFPTKHLPCRNVSGMSCQEYYRCPAWVEKGGVQRDSAYGVVSPSPPECCGIEYGAIRAINLSHLQCQGYSSAYSLAPLRQPGPGAWNYGIRVSYSLPANERGFCGACEATGGVCGYDQDTRDNLCICDSYNTTTNCDSTDKVTGGISATKSYKALNTQLLTGFFVTSLLFLR